VNPLPPVPRARTWLDPDRWPATLLLAGVLGLAFWMLALATTKATPEGAPPDEWAHISYVHEAATGPGLLPDYQHSRILPARKTRNYLNHPPLYYSLLGLAAKAFGLDASIDYRAFRAISAGFVALGLALWVLVARMLGFSLLQTVPLALSVSAVPMFPYLAGSINNDNLAYLAVAIAFVGLAGLERMPRAAWYIGATGLGMALLTKGTAGVFLVLVFGSWIVATVAGPSRRMLRNRHFVMSLAGLLLVVGGYYAFAFAQYGTFLPTSGILRTAGAAPVESMSFAAFLVAFFRLMLHYVPMITDHAPVAPLGAAGKFLCFASIILPLTGLLASKPGTRRGTAGRLAAVMVVAGAATLAAHVALTWNSYQRLGGIYSTQPRYYFYLLPGFSVLGFAGYRENRLSRHAFHAFVVVVLAAAAIVPLQTMRAERLRHAAAQRIDFQATAPMAGPPRKIGLDGGSAGHLDLAQKKGSVIELRGWAVDEASSRPASRLDIYYDGRRVGTLDPGRPRPDVAAALDDDDARNAGFEGRIESVPSTVSPCDLQFAAVQQSGQSIEILPSKAACQ
jgi:hypothetical protein